MLVVAVLTVLTGLYVGLDAMSWAFVLACIGAVLTTELINTAIETVVDLVSPEVSSYGW